MDLQLNVLVGTLDKGEVASRNLLQWVWKLTQNLVDTFTSVPHAPPALLAAHHSLELVVLAGQRGAALAAHEAAHAEAPLPHQHRLLHQLGPALAAPTWGGNIIFTGAHTSVLQRSLMLGKHADHTINCSKVSESNNSDVRGFIWSSWALPNFFRWHVFGTNLPLTHHEFG